MTSEVKYPNVSVQLVGEDGNAYSILGRVSEALRGAHVPKEEIAKFQKEATSGDYNNLLATVMAWVTTDEDDEDMEDTKHWEGIGDEQHYPDPN